MKLPCATFPDTRHVVQTTKISFPTCSATENWTTKSWHFRWIRKQVLLFYTNILTYAQA